MTIDTKTAPRRDVRYQTMEDFERDLDRVEAALASGRLRTSGNWSAGQVLEHLAKFAQCAFDGFPSRAPWIIRKMIILMFKRKIMSGEPMPAGYKIPRQAMFLAPGDGVSAEDGVAQMRAVFARLHRGDRFTAESPIFERLSHEEWCKAQLGHAAMHMSFLMIDDGGTPAEDDWSQPVGGGSSEDGNDDGGDGD